MLCKKGALKSLTKFTGKYLSWNLIFNKVAGLRLQLYLKRDSKTGVFQWIFAKFLRTPFFTENLWRLLLNVEDLLWLRMWFDLINLTRNSKKTPKNWASYCWDGKSSHWRYSIKKAVLKNCLKNGSANVTKSPLFS